MKKRIRTIFLLILFIAVRQKISADTVVVEKNEEKEAKRNALMIPYAFSSETFEMALGIAALGSVLARTK